MIDFTDLQWRFNERVKRLVDRGRTQQEAEEIVKRVIETKEQPKQEAKCLSLCS